MLNQCFKLGWPALSVSSHLSIVFALIRTSSQSLPLCPSTDDALAFAANFSRRNRPARSFRRMTNLRTENNHLEKATPPKVQTDFP